LVNGARKLLVYLAHICDKQSQDQIAMGLTHNYLNATEPQSLIEVRKTMKTKVQKLGPGSWVVFVNGQRHHETFRTRAAARREAKRQTEVNVSHTTIARLEGDHNSIR
jgi:sarcosine oxidase gamma subunit